MPFWRGVSVKKKPIIIGLVAAILIISAVGIVFYEHDLKNTIRMACAPYQAP